MNSSPNHHRLITPFRKSSILGCFLLTVGLGGCGQRSDNVADEVLNASGKFGVYWPPYDLGRPLRESDKPLLNGELSVVNNAIDQPNAFRMRISLRRPRGEADRIRWNESLAFPEYSWMAKVRVWDRDRKWLWPNLPYLLRAHGEERVERYGGIDPGKGVDNDFAAVLIRSLDLVDNDERKSGRERHPLVAAEWYPAGGEVTDEQTIVHNARSDDFVIHLPPDSRQNQKGRLGVWLIYADFLGSSMPRKWPRKMEYAGGILAYFQVTWHRSVGGKLEFDIKHLIPPTDTGFDWEAWSTGPSSLTKHLEMTYGANQSD